MNINETQEFDFSKYYIKDEAIENETPVLESTPIKEQQESGEFDFSKYYEKTPSTTLGTIGRHAARTGARVAETILGFPGDLVKLGQTLKSKIPGSKEELTRPNIASRAIEKGLSYLPTSADIKEVTSYLTSGFTDPESAKEELGDELTSLATVLVNPTRAVQSFPAFLRTLGRSLGIAGATKGAGKGAELLGADEKSKNYVEMGTLFLTSLLGRRTARRYVSERYDQARNLIPDGVIVNTNRLDRALEQVEQHLSRGITTPTKNEVRQSITELRNRTSQGEMELEDLIESYHNINERLSSKKLFDELNTSQRRLLRTRYDLVRNEIAEEMERYGRQNPEFYNTWQQANEGFATLERSRGVSNFLQSKLGKIPQHLISSVAFDLFLKTPYVTSTVLGGSLLVKMSELLYRIARSPTLREHYTELVREASNENLPAVIKHLNALDKAVPKEKDDQSE